MIFESLGKPANRKLLEEILAELAGRPVALKMELRDDAPDPEFSAKESGDPATPGGNGQAKNRRETPAAVESGDPVESFKNDPLIRKALEIFEGEIRPDGGSTARN